MADFENEKKALHDAMVAYKVPGILDAVEKARAAGMNANDIINAMGDGMTDVGVLFERGKLFLPHVLSAAAGMTKAMETLNKDLDDIGKSICSTMLQCAGFEVHDLGRDVPKQKFVDEVAAGAGYCGMSALMTTTMTVMKDVIGMLKDAGLRDKTIVMVGGAPVTQAYCDKIGADIYGESASETTEKVKAATEV